MKKALLLSLIALSSMGAQAQKKSKAVLKPLNPTTDITTKTDSLSYALGQNITNGLKQHLYTTGVLKDTIPSAVIENYDQQMADADEAGKAKLEKEYKVKLAEVKKENLASFKLFEQGLLDAMNSGTENLSYNTGVGIGNQFASIATSFEKEMLDNNELNKKVYIHSILASLREESPVIENSQDYLQSVAMEMQQAAQIREAEELKAKHGARISEGVKFLAENKEKEGVVVLPSGLQYKIEVDGTGKKPSLEDQVTVHYEGRLLDGSVFDSSYKRGEPATFGVTQVIKGWTEVLQLMPEGSKWTVYIPQDLAYGDRDSGPIPPFSTLVFDIELVKIAE